MSQLIQAKQFASGAVASSLGLSSPAASALAAGVGVASGFPQMVAPTINVGSASQGGDATVISGTYNNSTGAVSLTLSAAITGLTSGLGIYTKGLSGSGASQIAGWYTTTSGSGGATLNFTAATGLGSITISGGTILLPLGFAPSGGNTSPGLMTGHCAIGNYVSGTDAFVPLLISHYATNPSQEQRGIATTMYVSRSTADETQLGQDTIGAVFATVVDTTNTQNFNGNFKSGNFEQYFLGTGYSVANAYNLQANLVSLASGVTLSSWQGIVITGLPSVATGGTITNGWGAYLTALTAVHARGFEVQNLIGTTDAYGLRVGNIVAPAGHGAALKIDGTGTGNAIQFAAGSAAIYQDSSGKLTLDANSTYLAIANPLAATTATAGANGALPATVQGYLQVLIGGVAYKIPYYQT